MAVFQTQLQFLTKSDNLFLVYCASWFWQQFFQHTVNPPLSQQLLQKWHKAAFINSNKIIPIIQITRNNENPTRTTSGNVLLGEDIRRKRPCYACVTKWFLATTRPEKTTAFNCISHDIRCSYESMTVTSVQHTNLECQLTAASGRLIIHAQHSFSGWVVGEWSFRWYFVAFLYLKNKRIQMYLNFYYFCCFVQTVTFFLSYLWKLSEKDFYRRDALHVTCNLS